MAQKAFPDDISTYVVGRINLYLGGSYGDFKRYVELAHHLEVALETRKWDKVLHLIHLNKKNGRE